MSAADSFFDTNVLLHLLSKDAAKADLAETLLATGGVVSVQVLNEFASVATRKLAMTIPEIREILSTIRAICVVRSLDIETHDLGLEMAERYGFSIYDGQIVAAALQIARRRSASLLRRRAHKARQSLASFAPRRAHALGLGGAAVCRPPRGVAARANRVRARFTENQAVRAVGSENRFRLRRDSHLGMQREARRQELSCSAVE
jgi:predicted nucleic acid-binding protein